MPIDRRKIISIFKSEAEDYIQKLNEGFLALEKNPKDLSQVKELLRIAHSLKGASRGLGFNEIQDIAHKMEDVLNAIEKSQTSPDSKIILKKEQISKLLIGCDDIDKVLKDVIQDKKISIDVKKTCDILDTIFKEEEKDREKSEIKDFKSKQLPDTEISEKLIEKPTLVLEEYIKVSTSKISKILNLIGELIISKMESSQKVTLARKMSKLTIDLQNNIKSLSTDLRKCFDVKANQEIYNTLHQCIENINNIQDEASNLFQKVSSEAMHLDPIIEALQQRAKEMRMLPCSTIFETFPRLIRDIALKQKKEVELIIKGGDAELDRKVLGLVKSPLIHILRNCVDHGIELTEERKKAGKNIAGTITLSARQEGDSVFIVVEDDGRGLDVSQIKQVALSKDIVTKEQLGSMSDKEAANLIFKDGFSTSKIITDVSGRGVGLDVVRNEIEKLKGSVSIESDKSIGTKVILKIPLTIAVIKALMVEIQGYIFAIPMLSIEETGRLNINAVSTIESKMVAQIKGRSTPLVHLRDILELPSGQVKQDIDHLSVVIVSSLDKRIAFIVDNIVGEQDIFMKNLSLDLGKIKNVSGAAILGTGQVVVILDVADMLVSARVAHPAALPQRAVEKEKKGKEILIVEDSLTTRELERSILESRGYTVDTAIDGIEALAKLRNKKFDLLTIDVEMPRMGGFALCGKLKKDKNFKDIPIIIITTKETEEDKRRGIEVGAQAYIVKGRFDQTNLIDTIERLIG
ncbi:response regulator [Candidatus Omnitrophota bacterium]